MDDAAKWRIYPVGSTPLASQPVETLRQRIRARVEVELKLGVQRAIDVGGHDPVVLPVVAIADVELVFQRVQLALVRLRRLPAAWT